MQGKCRRSINKQINKIHVGTDGYWQFMNIVTKIFYASEYNIKHSTKKKKLPQRQKKTTNRKIKMFHHLYLGHSAISSIEKFNKKKLFCFFCPSNICVELQCTQILLCFLSRLKFNIYQCENHKISPNIHAKLAAYRI